MYLRVIGYLNENGAEGVILEYTEIRLIIKQEHTDIKVFDAAAIHIENIVDQALES